MPKPSLRNELSLDVERVDRLLLHEETDPSFLESLKAEILKDRCQIDPVVADSLTLTVLDGMHRVEALRELGADKILVNKIDYSQKSVRVYRWLRAFRANARMLSELAGILELVEHPLEEALRLVDSGEASFAIVSNNASYVSWRLEEDRPLNYVRTLDRLVRERAPIVYVAEAELEGALRSGLAVVYYEQVGKALVVRAAREGKPLPQKTTRHVIPYRVLNVCYPLDMLLFGVLLEEAREALEALLERKRVRIVGPQILYKGRLYEEPLRVLEDA